MIGESVVKTSRSGTRLILMRLRLATTAASFTTSRVITRRSPPGCRRCRRTRRRRCETTLTVVPDRAGDDALTRFGLYPAQIWSAIAECDTVEDAVRALLTRSSGEPNGLTIALIAEVGTDAFVEAIATTLRCSVGAIDHLVREIIPPATQVRLTGAEAAALGLRRAGVRVAFAYAGTSELALCDAFARLALLVNGRGDKEALFEAGGAAVPHG